MEAQEFFYIIASIALILISLFIGTLFFVVYKINKIARTSFKALTFASHDMRNSMSELAKNWGRLSLVSLAFRLFRTFIIRR